MFANGSRYNHREGTRMDDQLVELVRLYESALTGLAMARGLAAAYETRVDRARRELLRTGFLPDEKLSELGLKISPLTIVPAEPFVEHLQDGSVESLPRRIFAK
jgi:hypothetical protein